MAQCHRDYRNLGPYDSISQYPLGMSFGIQLGGMAGVEAAELILTRAC